MIHGDGDYLYHDTTGNEYTADEVALAGARNVALQNPNAEVFIFHQKPSKHFLFFFPLRDGEFFYYRNGQLIANTTYWWNNDQSRFVNEAGLYEYFLADNQNKRASIFLYFGHEIPEFGNATYDASYPDRSFTIHDLAEGLKAFTRHSQKFDLLVLSTCFGGTPLAIRTLGPFANYIIASPDNLHLSFLDLHPLEHLDLYSKNDVSAFAKKFARNAFDRLTQNVQTAVSVAVYDVERVQEYVRSVQINDDRTVTAINHCDCADLPEYAQPTMTQGVDVLYRSARFGRSAQKQSHSGWECWNDPISRTATPKTLKQVLK